MSGHGYVENAGLQGNETKQYPSDGFAQYADTYYLLYAIYGHSQLPVGSASAHGK